MLKCIDFGSYWCRRALPGTPVVGKISRDAMVILMAAQMFLHSIKYGKRAIFGSWLHHAMQTQPRAWEAARGCVHASICGSHTDHVLQQVGTRYLGQFV